MLRRLLLARSRASLMAASKPSGETALISLTLATLMLAFLLPACATKKPFGTRAGSQTKGPSSERMSASEMIPTRLLYVLVRPDSDKFARCDVVYRHRVRVATLGNHPRDYVAVGNYCHGALSVHYRQRSLLLLEHPPRCIHYAR